MVDALSLITANAVAHFFLLALPLILADNALISATVTTVVALIGSAAFLSAVLSVIRASITAIYQGISSDQALNANHHQHPLL